MNDIAHNLAQVRDKISAAAARCYRAPEEVTLLAVSKTKPAGAIEEAMTAGQVAFGENYVQEGVEKIRYFQEKGATGLQWHFIGPLQSNKSRLVVEHFDWCHTVDRLKIAMRLSEQRPAQMPPLNVLIQINISDEQSKSGIPVDELDALAAEIAKLPNLQLRGLMYHSRARVRICKAVCRRPTNGGSICAAKNALPYRRYVVAGNVG